MTNHMYAYGELADGTTWDNVRVTLASKIQLEKSCKANRWDTSEDQFTTSAFLSWHTARTAGLIDCKWSEFLEQAVDAGITATTAEDTDAGEDPTQPGPGTE